MAARGKNKLNRTQPLCADPARPGGGVGVRPRRRSWLLALSLALAAAPLAPTPGSALDSAVIRGLRELAPEARLEQRCDIEAMSKIGHAKKGYHPDRVVAAATAAAKVDGDTLQGSGAAFRSKGKWYRLAFTCKTSNDHMDVVSFDFEIGAMIPEDKWQDFGLWE